MEIFGHKVSRGLCIMLVALFLVAFVLPIFKDDSTPGDLYEQIEHREKILKDKASAEYASVLESLGLEDEKLRACASRIMYDLSKNRVKQVSANDVNHLYCPHQNIAVVEGLDVFPNLQFLDLSNNSISQLKLTRRQQALQQLKLSGNPLRSLRGLSHLGSLVQIRLPDMPKYPCSKLFEVFDELDHNLRNIKCRSEKQIVVSGRDYSAEQQRLARKAKSPAPKEREAASLSSRQERELLDYENRYGR